MTRHVASTARYQKTPEGKASRRRAKLKYLYGITEEQYAWLAEQQDGVCFLCGEAESVPHHANDALMSLAVDHDHGCTARHSPKRACPLCIRGLLCYNCNRMIGRAERSPRLAARFADYLARRPLALLHASLPVTS
jgi:hypothetical protein